jgi:hypothetical protein
MASHHDSAQRARRRRAKSEYFMKPGKQGEVSVFRRPAGNRIEPKLCGTMPSKALALALVRQLEQAESVVNDLFLEATDDGIEALEAILRACRESVERRASRQHAPREAKRRRGQDAPPRAASPEQPAAGDGGSESPAGDGGPRRGPRRRRSRPNRRGRPGSDGADQG